MPVAIVALDHGLCQAVWRVQAGVRETITVRDPALVDLFVFERHNAHDLIAFCLYYQVGAYAIVWADCTAACQFPGTCGEAERLGGKRAHRTDVDHVAGKLGLNSTTDKSRDFGVLATAQHAHFHHASDFLAEA